MTRQPSTSSTRQTRIVYLASKDVLVSRVSRNCIMHLCEALEVLGADVELISLRVQTHESEPTRHRSIWDVYGIHRPFRLTMIPTPLAYKRKGPRLVANAVLLFYRVIAYPVYAYRAYRRRDQDGSRPGRTVFYTRKYAVALAMLPMRVLFVRRIRVVMEVHYPPASRLRKIVLKLVDGVACQSAALQHSLVQAGVISERRSIGRHGGFSPELTEQVRVSRREARERLGWDLSARIACYTGKVSWGHVEIELLMQAASLLAEADVRFVFVGGRADQVNLWREETARRGMTNVEFVEFVPPADVPLYQMAADALLLYYEPGRELNDYRSPGKLFEYMAASTPAVVSDYLSIREVIEHEHNGLLVPPGRPDLLAAAVRRLFDEPALADRLASQAREDATSFTWEATARATLSLVDRL